MPVYAFQFLTGKFDNNNMPVLLVYTINVNEDVTLLYA